MRYLVPDPLAIKRMEIGDYFLRMKVYQLRKLDKLQGYTELALINRKVNATDKNGKYKVKKMDDVISFEKKEKEILQIEDNPVFERLERVAMNLKTYRREGHE